MKHLLQSSIDKEHGLSDTVDIQQLVLDQLQQQANEYDLPGLEIVDAVVLSPLKEWDVTNVSVVCVKIICMSDQY